MNDDRRQTRAAGTVVNTITTSIKATAHGPHATPVAQATQISTQLRGATRVFRRLATVGPRQPPDLWLEELLVSTFWRQNRPNNLSNQQAIRDSERYSCGANPPCSGDTRRRPVVRDRGDLAGPRRWWFAD